MCVCVFGLTNGWRYFELYLPYCMYCRIWMDVDGFRIFCRCSWKTFPMLLETPPIWTLAPCEKVRRLGGSFRGQAVAAFHVLSWRGKTQQISGAELSWQDMQTPPGFPIMWLVQCRKPARDSEWWGCCTYMAASGNMHSNRIRRYS